MSSVKRSTLASSELGQLKAPDKWETSSKTTNALAANTSDSTCDTMSSSSAATVAKTQTQQQSRDAQKSGSSTQQVTKSIDRDDDLNLNDNELKNLLDEAYSYKGPKDKENKSEIFKELLHNVELEDKQRDTFYSSHHFRGSSRRPHTSSLQDLANSNSNEQSLDLDYMSGTQSRRHHQNSRYTKNSSSVSSRQREGGSLPNNVNSSSCYPISSFQISKYPKTNAKSSVKTKLDAHDYERSATNHHRTAFIGESVSYCEEIQPSIASTSASVIKGNDKKHTIINIEDPEVASHFSAHNSLAQDTSEKPRDDGTELVQLNKPRMNATMSQYLSTVKDGEAARQNCHVDTPIHFLKYSSPVSDSSKIYTKSPIDPKYAPSRHVHLTPTQVAPNKLDENGNAILPKPTTIPLTTNPPKLQKQKRSNKADRNTTTWTVPQGSDYNIDSIVAFIENKEISKKTNIINVNKNNLSATERNRKEKKNLGGNNKKEENRLKKSTSMEELKSSSKIEEENAQSQRAQVSLRQKQMENAQKRSTTADNAKNQQSNNSSNNNKRGERRSWGTEELNDFDASTEDRDTKKHKETKPNTKNNKKSEQFTSTNASIESIPTNVEAAEFHVVTKKKKTKKRQILEEAKAKQQQMNQRDLAQSHGRNSNSNTSSSGGSKYQPSSTYTNDRDIYVNSLMTKENRRKSTSSVPPSDKSDSSDLDSVHSLPIESTATCTSSSSIISYAEMARKTNQPPEKLSNVNAWPSVSQNGKSSESPENSNFSTSSSTVSSRSHVSNKSYDTIKASSPSEEKSYPNLDDSRTMETPKQGGEYVKNQLQKSKSCDNEKYTTTMSLDQFPGLEKTVKPQKSHQNFASVLTSPPPLTPTSATSTPAATQTPAPVFPTSNEKPAIKGQNAKKSPTPTETNIPKENAIKLQQKSVEEKVDNKIIIDANCSKLQFVQNSAKAEEIANSDSCNLFVPINMKKTKKSQPNVIAAQRTARQTAVIFSDRETNHENVSPLLFGDFNDDILQLMKQEENHVGSDTPNGPMLITNDSSASNCTNAFESADNHTIYDCNQSKPNILTPMMSSQSDPGYASAHRTTVPTESHEVVDIHQIHTENPVGNSTITELSSRKSNNVTKKTTLNKINVNNNNNKISDVVSNQSLNNNNNMINNNVSVGDATAKMVTVSQSISDSDSLNNNINIQMNDKIRNHGVDGSDVMKAQQQQQPNDAGVTKMFNAQNNNVHSTVSKASNQSVATNYQQQKGIIAHDSVNKSIDNISNGPKMVVTSNKLSSTENEVVPVNSHPANVPQKTASFAETRVPFVTHNHNHNDIVHFVGSAWEEVKFGRAHYFSGQ